MPLAGKHTNRYCTSRGRHRPRRRCGGPHALAGTLRLGVVFAILVGINVYVFFFRGGTSIQDLLKASSIRGAGIGAKMATARPEALRPSAPELRAGNANSNHVHITGSMKGHLGLAPALIAAGVGPTAASELVNALRGVLDLRALQPRHRFDVYLGRKDGLVESFKYHLSSISRVVASRDRSGTLVAKRDTDRLEVKVVRLGGRIESSLHRAVHQAGESAELASTLVRLFDWDINWVTDPRPGDQFRVIVEKRFHKGRFHGYGHVLVAEYASEYASHQVVYFVRKDGKGGYYTSEGRSIERAFLKTPLNYRRISSGFDTKRMHPVLHRTKGHFGVDYAAPTGTPIWAAAAGRVLKIGRHGGAGKMVLLQHASGVRTVYMHMHRFAKGLRRGDQVRQRQYIGQVGATGLATGPHLHYGIYVRGRPIDPQEFEIGKGPLLPAAEHARFGAELPLKLAALQTVVVPGRDRALAQLPGPAGDDWLP